jgi:transcriptional regulator with XRE-family HTH domain
MKKRTPLEPRQQWYAHRALRAARKAAGFKSASAAAENLGFTNAKYRSQEAGSRPISLEDATQYASAFGITLEALTSQTNAILTESFGRSTQPKQRLGMRPEEQIKRPANASRPPVSPVVSTAPVRPQKHFH